LTNFITFTSFRNCTASKIQKSSFCATRPKSNQYH